MLNTYPVLKEKTEISIKNAKKVEKYHLDLGQTLDNENCNPYTSAYKVVEELIKEIIDTDEKQSMKVIF